MQTEIWAAFVLGFLGSFHCIGMCGPIALALPVPKSTNTSFISGRILYNLGRVISYSILGAVFGLLGKGIALSGFQQILSISLGIIIIAVIILPQNLKNHFYKFIPVHKITSPFRSSIGKLFKVGTLNSLLAIGFLNGFLPCGFVYMGVAAAIASGGILSGALVMAGFGLGTFPAMFTISVFGKYINLNVRKYLRKATPVFALILGIIFILRGLNLGIPYVSPKLSSHSVNPTEQMHKH